MNETALSTLARNRIAELEHLRNAHLSRAVDMERKGRTLTAWQEHQAAAAVNYRLAVIKSKLAGLEYARRMTNA